MRGRFVALLLVLVWPASGTAGQPELLAARTVVVLEQTTLSAQDGTAQGAASPGQALELADRQGPRLLVRLASGQQAWLSEEAGAVLPGPPRDHEPRLARLAAAPLSQVLRRRLLAGLIAAGDWPWQVELAWGRPWRSFMVNLFHDEEHYVYRDASGRPILLRFKGGRLEAPLPRESLAVESSPTPR